MKDLLQHVNISVRQRDSYNLQKNNIDTTSLFIESDWKQKVLIGNLFILSIRSFTAKPY